MNDTFCIRIHICKKYFIPVLLCLRWKTKVFIIVLILEKVLVFGFYLPLDLMNLFNIALLFNKFLKLILTCSRLFEKYVCYF